MSGARYITLSGTISCSFTDRGRTYLDVFKDILARPYYASLSPKPWILETTTSPGHPAILRRDADMDNLKAGMDWRALAEIPPVCWVEEREVEREGKGEN